MARISRDNSPGTSERSDSAAGAATRSEKPRTSDTPGTPQDSGAVDQLEGDAEGNLRDAARMVSEKGRLREPDGLEPGKTTTVKLVGDTAFGGAPGVSAIHRRIRQAGGSSEAYFPPAIAAELRQADATVANLECAVLENRAAHDSWKAKPFAPYRRAFYLWGPPESLDFAGNQQQGPGVDIVTLANNHIWDFGEKGAEETVERVHAKGFAHAGAGKGNGALAPALYTTEEGERIAVFSVASIYGENDTIPSAATPSVADEDSFGVAAAVPETYKRIQAAIAEQKAAGVDLVILYVHWGKENVRLPAKADVRLAHLAIDAGADAVVGSHPHVLTAMGVYKGRPIFYSLSNFVFNPAKTGILKLDAPHDTDRVVRVGFLPARIPDWGKPVEILDEKGAEQVISRLRRSSEQMEAQYRSIGARSLFGVAEPTRGEDGYFYFDLTPALREAGALDVPNS